MNIKVLITGGAGFIGSHLIDFLLINNYEVYVIDNLSSGSTQFINKDVQFFNVDICSDQIELIFKIVRPDIVIHLASISSVSASLSEPITDLKVNVIGTVNILNQCIKYNIKKFVFSSSASVYGDPENIPINEECNSDPMSPYGLSKKTSEKYIEMYGELYNLPYSILRFSNVYGPRQSMKSESGVISIFIDSILKGKRPIINGSGNQTRDFIYVSDIITAIHCSMRVQQSEIYNVSNNTELTILEILKILCKLEGISCNPFFHPLKKGDILRSSLDNTKIKNELGWVPKVDIHTGLCKTLDYYKIFI